jgi:hypothetical protein
MIFLKKQMMMHKMVLNAAWVPALVELDITYPKRVNILVDKFDRSFVPEDEIRIVVIWEPTGHFVSDVMTYPDFYSYVFTYHDYILKNNPKAHFFMGITIFVDPHRTHDKRFGVSTVVGHKTRSIFPGYKMRHELWFRQEEIKIPKEFFLSGEAHYKERYIPTLWGDIDVEGQRRIKDSKDEVFDTMFHIAIENAHMDNFFTEKITDCFMTRTVPIYIGAKNIGDFFDARGIISVNSIDEAIRVCNTLTEEDYHSMSEAIEINYKRSLEYADYNKLLTKKILEVLP